ncbi:MAG TPA: peptidyl-prolyl cis-trans isomerase [Pirellulales bacterium]
MPRRASQIDLSAGAARKQPSRIAGCALVILMAVVATGDAFAQDPSDPYAPQQMMPVPFGQSPQMNPNNFMMPGPPGNVGTPARPAGWPGSPPPPEQQNVVPMGKAGAVPNAARTVAGTPQGGAPPPGAPGAVNGGASLPPSAKWNGDERSMQFDLLDLDGARIVARIGPEVIQESEVKSYIEEVLEQNASKIPPQHLEKVREKLMRDRLNHLVEIKLALVDAQRKVPTDTYPKIVDGLGEEFENKEVRRKLKQLNLGTRGDLEEKLRLHGTSIEREKQAFVEQQLAFGWIGQQTRTKHEVTHEDMLAYYLEHIENYSFPAQARWEELRVRTTNFPNRDAARQALGELGNAVLQGANFAEVAKARSQGPTAAIGGQYDWTTEGSLAWEILDQAIFSVPVGRLSQILDDGRSPTMSIVRVVERKEAGRRPFTEVQVEIKEKLAVAHTEKDKQKLHEYVDKLRDQIPIWTIYDDDPKTDATAAKEPSADGSKANTTMRPATPAMGAKTPRPNPYLR